MSQHFVKFIHGPLKCEVLVQLGWDRPLQGFYLIAQKVETPHTSDADEGFIYENLSDCGHPKTLERFKAVSKELGLQIPDVMWRNAYQDSQLQVVNQQKFYDIKGNLIAPF